MGQITCLLWGQIDSYKTNNKWYASSSSSAVNAVVMEEAVEEEWAYDPNEPRYCICNQVSYGDMVACDNQDVSVATHRPHLFFFHFRTARTQTNIHIPHTVQTSILYTLTPYAHNDILSTHDHNILCTHNHTLYTHLYTAHIQPYIII